MQGVQAMTNPSHSESLEEGSFSGEASQGKPLRGSLEHAKGIASVSISISFIESTL